MIAAAGSAAALYITQAENAEIVPATPAAQLGERFLAHFEDSGNWYVAVAVGSTEDDVDVVYVDGTIETHRADVLRFDGLGPGSQVLALRRDGSAACVLEERRGSAVRVRYEDGTLSWRSLAYVSVSDMNIDQPGVAEPAGDPEEVLAIWKDDPWLYPGVVIGREDAKVHVLFEDGAADWRAPGQVRRFTLKAGDSLEVKVGDDWTPAIYIQRLAGGHAVAVELNGATHWTAFSRIRMPVGN